MGLRNLVAIFLEYLGGGRTLNGKVVRLILSGVSVRAL